MTEEDLKTFIKDIVADAVGLKDRYTNQTDIPVGYACVFAQSETEFNALSKTAEGMAKTLLKSTTTGPVFKIPPLMTRAGALQILKIRTPDPLRKERGDADFNLPDYTAFKTRFIGQSGFKLIPRETFEMIELAKPNVDVRVYFSNPPVEQQYNL